MTAGIADAFMAGAAHVRDRAEITDCGCGPSIDWPNDTEEAAIAYADSPAVAVDIGAARLAWERLEAACAGLLASQCKSHRPYYAYPVSAQ